VGLAGQRNAARVWTVNPDAWANDKNLVGPTVYQPLLFAGQYQDTEAAAYENDGVHSSQAGLGAERVQDVRSVRGRLRTT